MRYQATTVWRLDSTNLQYNVRFQKDGNFVVYRDGSPETVLWASNTVGNGRILHSRLGTGEVGDVDIETSNSTYTTFHWENHVNVAYPASGFYVNMQNDGNFVEYGGGHALWATNTCPGCAAPAALVPAPQSS